MRNGERSKGGGGGEVGSTKRQEVGIFFTVQ
jgi:hypothetical protein